MAMDHKADMKEHSATRVSFDGHRSRKFLHGELLLSRVLHQEMREVESEACVPVILAKVDIFSPDGFEA
jgi:hypothetical protein